MFHVDSSALSTLETETRNSKQTKSDKNVKDLKFLQNLKASFGEVTKAFLGTGLMKLSGRVTTIQNSSFGSFRTKDTDD